MDSRYVVWLSELGFGDVPLVGGKNSSLGELIGKLAPDGIIVPDGFATTAGAYREFMRHNDLEQALERELGKLRLGPGRVGGERSRRSRRIPGVQATSRAPGAAPPEAARSYTYVVRDSGEYDYVCLLHAPSGMVGTIKVA